MDIYIKLITFSLIIGIGATLVMDAYALLVKRLFNIPSLDYALLGRWIGHFKNGRFYHTNIMQTEKIKHERIIGWLAHYLIGITFALLLVLIWGIDWVYKPTFWPPMVVGLATMVAPFLLMQPAFGFGIAASKTPNPQLARFRSLKAHTVYGIGMYLAALLLSMAIA